MTKKQMAAKKAFDVFVKNGWVYDKPLATEERLLAEGFDLDNGADINSPFLNFTDIVNKLKANGWRFIWGYNGHAAIIKEALTVYRAELAKPDPKPKTKVTTVIRNKTGQFHKLRPGSVYWVAGALARCKSAENKSFSVHGALNGTVTDLSRVRLATKDEVETYLAESKSNG